MQKLGTRKLLVYAAIFRLDEQRLSSVAKHSVFCVLHPLDPIGAFSLGTV